MKIRHTLAIAVAVVGLGVIATWGLAAQGKRTLYVVIEVDEITDADGYKAMAKLGLANIAEAKYLDARYPRAHGQSSGIGWNYTEEICANCF